MALGMVGQVANGWVLRSSGSVGRPQARTQAVFEAGEGVDVGPGRPVEDVGDDGVVDAGRGRGGAQAAGVQGGAQVEGEQASSLHRGVGRGGVGPVGHLAGGRGTARSTHRVSVGGRGWCDSQDVGVGPAVIVGNYQRSVDVEGTITRYEPRTTAKEWPVIGDFVREAVRDCQQRTAYSARELLIVGSKHVAWCDAVGYPLERDVVFRREIIAEFINTACDDVAASTRGNYRSKLFRMSEHLLSPHLRHSPVPPVRRDDPARPYTVAEVLSLRSWASGQNTDYRQANAWALLALGLGAGLSAAELSYVTAAHIVTDAHGVLVIVEGPRARQVPVLQEWENILAGAAQAAAAPSQFLFRADRTKTHRHLVSNFVDKTIQNPVRASSQRMRATWLVTHMIARVRPDVLLQAAGVESLEALTRYLAYIPAADAVEMRATMRDSLKATRS